MALIRRTDEKVEALRSVSFLRTLNEGELRELSKHVHEVSVEEGAVLATEGEPGEESFLILEGGVGVLRGGQRIAERGPGDLIGEMSLIDGEPRSATVVADEDLTVLVMSRRDFLAALDRIPEMQRKVLIELSRRLREAEDRVTG